MEDNFPGKNEDQPRTIQVKAGIQNLSKEQQATIEFLVNHILNIFDHQDKDSKENIYNAWLPIFSNSTEINSYNSTFMDTVLEIYRSKRDLPTSTLPLKADFDFKFTTRDSADSIDDEYMTDYDRLGLYMRTSSTISDSTISFSSFKPRLSLEETRTQDKDEGSRISNRDFNLSDPMKLNEAVQKRDADTAELANKLKALILDAKKDGDTSPKVGDTSSKTGDNEKTQIENLQHRLSNLNIDNTTKKDDPIKKDLETMKKIVDVMRKDVDIMRKDVDSTPKLMDTIKKDGDNSRKNVDMKKIIGTIKKDVERTKNPGDIKRDVDNKFKPLVRTRTQSPSPVRVPASFLTSKTIQKRPTVKDGDTSQQTSSVSPILGKKLLSNVENKDRPPINLKGVVLSPVSQRKNFNRPDLSVDSEKDGDTTKSESKSSLFVKNAPSGSDNKRIDISKVHFNALNRIIGAQSLESIKARTEMTYKKS